MFNTFRKYWNKTTCWLREKFPAPDPEESPSFFELTFSKKCAYVWNTLLDSFLKGIPPGLTVGVLIQKAFTLPRSSKNLSFIIIYGVASLAKELGRESHYLLLRILHKAGEFFLKRTALIPLLLVIPITLNVSAPVVIPLPYMLLILAGCTVISFVKPTIVNYVKSKNASNNNSELPTSRWTHVKQITSKILETIIGMGQRGGQATLMKQVIKIFLEVLGQYGVESAATAANSFYLNLFLIVPAALEGTLKLLEAYSREHPENIKQKNILERAKTIFHVFCKFLESWGFNTIFLGDMIQSQQPQFDYQLTDEEYLGCMGGGVFAATVSVLHKFKFDEKWIFNKFPDKLPPLPLSSLPLFFKKSPVSSSSIEERLLPSKESQEEINDYFRGSPHASSSQQAEEEEDYFRDPSVALTVSDEEDDYFKDPLPINTIELKELTSTSPPSP